MLSTTQNQVRDWLFGQALPLWAEAGVDAELVPVEGAEHALGMLDGDLRERIATWLRERLAGPERPAG